MPESNHIRLPSLELLLRHRQDGWEIAHVTETAFNRFFIGNFFKDTLGTALLAFGLHVYWKHCVSETSFEIGKID